LGLHWTCVAAHQRVGNYWYMLPQAEQARKAIWEAINPHTGLRRIDEAFPRELRANTRESDMFIEFKLGSTWRPVGSDNFNSLVGSPPIGMVYSEYAISNPMAWDYMRPILRENGGWAIFNSTVRGRNHFWRLGEAAQTDSDWYFSQLDADATGVFTPEELAQELKELQKLHGKDYGELIFRQEYYNDPTAAQPGAYFSRAMARAENEGRLTAVPLDSMLPVYTSWDLGWDDYLVIWFWQVAGPQIRALDVMAFQGTSLPEVVKQMPKHNYAEHYLPHDVRVHELGSGKSRAEILDALGVSPTIVPDVGFMSGVEQVRAMIDRTWFDREKCAIGIEALSMCHSKYDAEYKVQSVNAVKDWTLHFADAARMFAVGYAQAPERRPIRYRDKVVA
jgi:phage terminase large subunit